MDSAGVRRPSSRVITGRQPSRRQLPSHYTWRRPGDPPGIAERFWAIQLHSPVLQGAPSDAQARGAIRPEPFNDGQHYCAEDWHVILLGIIIGGDASFKRAEAEAILNTVMLSFALDGVPLSTTRTTVKPFLNPEFLDEEKAYAFQEGRIMAPTDISVGSHQLVATVSEPGFPTEVLEITFFIDAPGTGVCL